MTINGMIHKPGRSATVTTQHT